MMDGMLLIAYQGHDPCEQEPSVQKQYWLMANPPYIRLLNYIQHHIDSLDHTPLALMRFP
jgi:hypothetical protein